jgi:ribosome-associated translation inhibitor RaiA
MQVQVNTDSHIEGTLELTQEIDAEVQGVLGRFSEQITRVEVHLSDSNGHKTGEADIRCLMEARPSGLQPIAVTQEAATIEQAVEGAVEKLEKALDRTFGKLGNRKGRVSFSGE